MLKEYHSIPIQVYACEVLSGGEVTKMPKDKGQFRYMERGKGAAMTNIIFCAKDPVETGDFIVMKDGEYSHWPKDKFNSEYYSQGKILR